MISGVSFALLTVCVAYHLNVCIQCCIRASCMHWYTERFGTAFAHCPVRSIFLTAFFFTLPHLPGALMLIIVGFFSFWCICICIWSLQLQHLGHLNSFRVCPSFLHWQHLLRGDLWWLLTKFSFLCIYIKSSSDLAHSTSNVAAYGFHIRLSTRGVRVWPTCYLFPVIARSSSRRDDTLADIANYGRS